MQVPKTSLILASGALLLASGFGAGYIAGDNSKTKVVEKKIVQKEKPVSVEKDYAKEYGEVKASGNISLDGIDFELKPNLSYKGDKHTVGLADINEKDVTLETDRSLMGFYQTCTHEVWGHIRSGYTHPDDAGHDEWVENMESQVVVETCLKLLHRIDGGGLDA